MHIFGVGAAVFAVGLLIGFIIGDNRPRYWPRTGHITVTVDPSPGRRGALVNLALDGRPLCWVDLDEKTSLAAQGLAGICRKLLTEWSGLWVNGLAIGNIGNAQTMTISTQISACLWN